MTCSADGETLIFPAQLTTSRTGNLTWLILTLAVCDDHTYIHTVVDVRMDGLLALLASRKFLALGCTALPISRRAKIRKLIGLSSRTHPFRSASVNSDFERTDESYLQSEAPTVWFAAAVICMPIPARAKVADSSIFSSLVRTWTMEYPLLNTLQGRPYAVLDQRSRYCVHLNLSVQGLPVGVCINKSPAVLVFLKNLTLLDKVKVESIPQSG